MVRILGILVLVPCSSCMDPAALPETERPPIQVTVTPTRGDRAERVVRVVIEGVRAADPKDLALFTGELSGYQLDRIDSGELPSNLLERRVPAVTWLDPETRKLTLAPTRVLELGARYTLTLPGYGRLATIDVDAGPGLPLLERLWPPKDQHGGGFVVLCAHGLPTGEAIAHVDPLGQQAEFSSPLGQDELGRTCGQLLLPTGMEPEQLLLLPHEINGFLVDPEAWQFSNMPGVAPAGCASPEIAVGPACATVEDDRLTMAAASEARLWIVSTALGTRISAVDPGRGFLLRGFQPNSSQHLEGSSVSPGGEKLEFSVDFISEPSRPHLVLNEVLANSLGPEPAAEWIEILNDGTSDVDFADFTVQDAGAEITLPSGTIESGGYALLVREDFAPRLDSDVLPEDGVLLIRLPALGKSGLSNTGEELILKDPFGRVQSRFPALSSKHAGVSMGRRHPDSFDEELSAFGEHAAPGASPGGMNQIVAVE